MSAESHPAQRASEIIGRLKATPSAGRRASTAKNQFKQKQKSETQDLAQDYIKRLQSVHHDSLVDHFKQKKHWSEFLMVVMWTLVMYQCILLALVGSGIWNFTGYPWLLPVLLGQNFAQIVGLAVFVVKDLFREKPIEPSGQ